MSLTPLVETVNRIMHQCECGVITIYEIPKPQGGLMHIIRPNSLQKSHDCEAEQELKVEKHLEEFKGALTQMRARFAANAPAGSAKDDARAQEEAHDEPVEGEPAS